MDRNTAEFAQKLQKSDAKAVEKPKNRADTVRELMERMHPQFAAVLPKHVTPKRLVRIALTVMRQQPALYECSDASLCGAVMTAAQLGLGFEVPNECFIIPYDGEARFQLGYKGLVKLVRRAAVEVGRPIEALDAQPVYANDRYERRRGSRTEFVHEAPPMGQDRGALVGFYAYARVENEEQWTEMTVQEVEHHRDRFSKAHQKARKYHKESLWDTNFVAMACKTVLRSLCWHHLDMSAQAGEAIAQDMANEQRDAQTYTLDPVTGEILDDSPLAGVASPPQPEPRATGGTAGQVIGTWPGGPVLLSQTPSMAQEEPEVATTLTTASTATPDPAEPPLPFDTSASGVQEMVDWIWDTALPGTGAIAERQRLNILEVVYEVAGDDLKAILARQPAHELQAGVPVIDALTVLFQTGKMPSNAITDARVKEWLRKEKAAFLRQQEA